MKTQKTKVATSFKKVAVLLFMMILGSCGSDNSSGNSSNQFTGFNASFNGYSNVAVQGYNGSLGTLLSQVSLQHPCALNGQWQPLPGQNYNNVSQTLGRQIFRVAVPQQTAVYTGKPHVGITAEGDIAVLFSQNGQVVLDVHACSRPTNIWGQNQQIVGQLVSQLVINPSYSCPMDEISMANVSYSNYYLSFYPAHIPNVGLISNLCR